MSFKSEASKYQAESTVSKLFSSILNTTAKATPNTTQTLSTTQILANQFNHDTPQKSKKNKQNKKIAKNVDREKKFSKFVKYTMIKNKSDHTVEEQKYLTKLAKKNIAQLQSVKIDEFAEEELNQVKGEVLSEISKPKRKRTRRVVQGKGKFDDFDSKVKRGLISVPGLTPGLAPVDYNESDSE
ncbi:Regulator of rDNA transcription 14 [Spathaspora sp. JA1]|nr:Regulator of rDNA transcription 14 [Spathaspora sp. JA1]